jgi:hypothetical protein
MRDQYKILAEKYEQEVVQEYAPQLAPAPRTPKPLGYATPAGQADPADYWKNQGTQPQAGNGGTTPPAGSAQNQPGTATQEPQGGCEKGKGGTVAFSYYHNEILVQTRFVKSFVLPENSPIGPAGATMFVLNNCTALCYPWSPQDLKPGQNNGKPQAPTITSKLPGVNAPGAQVPTSGGHVGGGVWKLYLVNDAEGNSLSTTPDMPSYMPLTTDEVTRVLIMSKTKNIPPQAVVAKKGILAHI